MITSGLCNLISFRIQLHVKLCHLTRFIFFLLDEQEIVQKRTFTKWINSHLAKVKETTYRYMFTYSEPINH